MMRALKPVLGLVLVSLAALPAKMAVVLFSAINQPQIQGTSGMIVHHTVIFHGHTLSGWKLHATFALLSILALSLFMAGLVLAFSILRSPK